MVIFYQVETTVGRSSLFACALAAIPSSGGDVPGRQEVGRLERAAKAVGDRHPRQSGKIPDDLGVQP